MSDSPDHQGQPGHKPSALLHLRLWHFPPAAVYTRRRSHLHSHHHQPKVHGTRHLPDWLCPSGSDCWNWVRPRPLPNRQHSSSPTLRHERLWAFPAPGTLVYPVLGILLRSAAARFKRYLGPRKRHKPQAALPTHRPATRPTHRCRSCSVIVYRQRRCHLL